MKRNPRKWYGVGLYIMMIILTTPWLPDIIKACARWCNITLPVMLAAIKLVTLSILVVFLIAYFILGGRYKNKTCWLSLIIIVMVGGYLAANFASPAEATHFFEYGLLSIIILYTLSNGAAKEKLSLGLYVKAALFTLLVGVADEIYQGFLPTRYYDINDIILNGISGMLGLLFIWGIAARKPIGNQPI